MSSSLIDQLGSLTADQLNTITFESGVDQNGNIPGYNGLISTQSFWTVNGGSTHSWQTALGAGASGILYAFDPAISATVFTAGVESAFAQALALWSDLANINFVYTPDWTHTEVAVTTTPAATDATHEADVGSIATATQGLDQTTSAAVYLNLSAPQSYGDPSSYSIGAGYGVTALVHETGHLLGLGHTGDYNAETAASTDYGPQEISPTDNRSWSIMSYIDPTDKTAKYYNSFEPSGSNWNTAAEESVRYDPRAPYTPMGLDIFAAQRLYGAPTNGVLSGGQTFGFHSNIMFTDIDGSSQPLSMYDFNEDTEPVVTLYDSGTGNKLDLSGFNTTSSTVDLQPGTWSSAAGLVNNIFIEYGTQIDTAVGGDMNDSFILNTDGDTIDGGKGVNTVTETGPRTEYNVANVGTTTTLTDIGTGKVDTLTRVGSVIFSDGGSIATSQLATITWDGAAGDGQFSTAGNWNPAVAPTSGSDVVIGDSATVYFAGSQTIALLALGTTAAVAGTAPVFNVNGGTLNVTTDIGDTYQGDFPDPTGAAVVSGGGTINIFNGGTVSIGGSLYAGDTVDFTDDPVLNDDVLALNGLAKGGIGAAAGTIEGFSQGDTILVHLAAPVTKVTDSYNAGVLTVSGDGTKLAAFNMPGDYQTSFFVVANDTTDLAITEEPLNFAWAPTDVTGDWSQNPEAWFLGPVTDPPLSGAVPPPADDAFITGGVTVTVSDAETIGLLGLGTNATLGGVAPIVSIGGGASLHVKTDIQDSFPGTFAAGIPTGSFAGGGTITLSGGATLEVGGTASASIAVDFMDGSGDVLRLDGANTATPGRFAAGIAGFVQGDTIFLAGVQADGVHYDTGTLTLTEGGAPIAALSVAGAFNSGNFNLSAAAAGTTITEQASTLAPPPAGSITWVGPYAADFNGSTSYWQPADGIARDPDDTDDVAIGNGDTVVVSNQPENAVDSLQIAAGAKLEIAADGGHFSIGDGTMSSQNQGEVDIGGVTQVEVYLSGTFVNNGLISFFGPGADLQTNDRTVTIGGVGTITMADGAIGGETADAANRYDTLVNLGNLIQGSGVIGRSGDEFLYPLNFVNDATVDANDSGLTLTMNTSDLSNAGVLETTNGGVLVLAGSVENVTAADGITVGAIQASGGGTVQLANATITGGALTQTDTGKIEIAANSALSGGSAGVAITGNVVVDSGAVLSLSGEIAGGNIDATAGGVSLSGASLSGVQLKGNVSFAGGGNTLYAAGYNYYGDQQIVDIAPYSLGAGGDLTLAPDPAHGLNGFDNSGTFTIGKGAVLGVAQTVAIGSAFSGGVAAEGNPDGVIRMTDPSSVIGGALVQGTPGDGGVFQLEDELVSDQTIIGVGLITGLQLENYQFGTIMASGGTLTLNSGTQFVTENGYQYGQENVSDGWLGAAAGSDLVLMGTMDLRPNILDGSSPGGGFDGTGTITLGGSIITGARAGTIVGGTIEASRTIQVVAPGGSLNGTENDGTVIVNGGALLTLYGGQDVVLDNPGSITNTGLIELNGSLDGNSVYQAASLASLGDVSLSGGGTIQLSGDGGTGADAIVSVTNSDTLENEDNLIEGTGLLGGGYLNLINRATIEANVAGANLTVDAGTLNGTIGAIDNGGLMEATGGGTLVIAGSLTNYGISYIDPVDYPNGIPQNGGDLGASGAGSAVDLSDGTVTAGRLFTDGGGMIHVTGNATLSGGYVTIPHSGSTAFGAASVVNGTAQGAQSGGAAAGLVGNGGRIVVAWEDHSGATPVVRYQILDQFGTRTSSSDLAVAPLAGTSQTNPEVAALAGGGFVITWLQSSGGATTLQAATFTADLQPKNSAITIATVGETATGQNMTALADGEFATVWTDTAGIIHVQRFSAAGLPGAIKILPAGVSPTIASATDGSGAYAVAWLSSVSDGEGTVYVQFFTKDGVASGAPQVVGTGDSPYIAPGQSDGAVIVFWNDPVNHPGVPQGQDYSSDGETGFFGTTASSLDYGGLYTPVSTLLPDGRIATVSTQPRPGSAATDVGLRFAGETATNYALLSDADIAVDAGHTLTVARGMDNEGTIALGSDGAVLAASGSVTINGGGAIELLGGAIAGATGSDTLTLDTTTVGSGQIGGGNLTLINQGMVLATHLAGAADGVLHLGGTLTNEATMVAAADGVLDFTSTVMNEGAIETEGGTVVLGAVADISSYGGNLEVSGGEMDLNGSVDVYQTVFFGTTGTGKLVINDPAQMTGNIAYLNVGDTIDVAGIAATSARFDPIAQALNLMSGGTTLSSIGLEGYAPAGVLAVAPDGKGGTLVDLLTPTLVGAGAAPLAVALPNGGFVEVFQPSVDGFPAAGVFAQIFDADKQPVSDVFQVDAAGEQPSIAAQSNGQFLIAWADTTDNIIQGRIYDATGTALTGTLNLTAAAPGDSETQTAPSVSAIQALTPSGYGVAYSTEDFSGGQDTKSVTYLDLSLSGAPRLTPVALTDGTLSINGKSYPFTGALSPSAISLAASSGVGQVVLATLSVDNPTTLIGQLIAVVLRSIDPALFSAAGVAGTQLVASEGGTITSFAAGDQTVLITPADDGKTHVSPAIVALTNGDAVVVWDEMAQADTTWTVAGQIVTQTGQFVGSQFTIVTALPAASTPDKPAVTPLANGQFVVTYDSGTGGLTAQKFDATGAEVGDPFSVSNSSQGSPAMIVLSDGTLLALSGDSLGTIDEGSFSVQASAAWSGASGSDLGNANNWTPIALPSAADTLTFSVAGGGTLTGTGTGLNAVFAPTGGWLLQGATLTLAGETIAAGSALALSDQGVLTVNGGSIAAGGSLDIDAASGAALAVLGGAQIAASGLSVGAIAGDSGALAISGLGSAIDNSGTSGTSLIGGAGTAQAAVSGGAVITNAAGAVLGAGAGGDGGLTVSDAGSQFDTTGETDVGAAGAGHLRIANQATVQSGGNAAASSLGFDVAELSGGSGDATVTGANSLLNNAGRFVVGDAGVGSLSIAAGATVITTPGAVSGLAGAVIANAVAASGSSVNVSGAGSNWQVAGLLDVGASGSGGLQISSGATVTAGSLDAANVAGAVGQIGLSGAGTELLVTNAATVADDGTGVLSVLSGATFSAASLTIGSQADSSGAAVVSGAGSELNVTGSLNIGTANGIGDLTVGPGAAIQAQAVFEQGQVVLEGGLLDPTVQLINQGQTAGGFGTIAAGDIVDEGAIQAGGNKGSQKLLIVQGTVLGGGTLTVNGTLPGSVPAGIMQINAGGTLELSGAVLNAATTTFTDNLTPQGTYTVNNSVIDVNFVDAAGVLLLGDIAEFGGTIATYQAGDSFVVTGGTLSGLGVSNGDTLTVSDGGVNAAAGGTDQIIFGSAVSAAGFKIVNNNTIQAQVPCFAEGTRIETEHGPVAVEHLAIGDRVVLADGTHEPIMWIGRREVNCARHPEPRTVWPVRVRAGAFGEDGPVRDLYLSPDHAVFVNEVLVPVKLLIGGTAITQVTRAAVTYYHVELARHAVILAEGLPVESYLDTGDHANFHRHGEPIRLFPDFAAHLSPHVALAWEARGAARLVMTGEELAAARLVVREPVPRSVRQSRGRAESGARRAPTRA